MPTTGNARSSPGAETSTSTHRTYRFLRISLVGVVVLLGAALTQYLATQDQPLASISASFYTPVHNVFVGSMVAVGLALIALSGRSWRQVMLNLAGLLAPVIAFVPTPIAAGAVPAFPEVTCRAAAQRCIPSQFEPEVEVGVIALLVVGLIGLTLAVVFNLRERHPSPGSRPRIAVGLVASALLLVGSAVVFFGFRDLFLTYAHHAATLGFFALIAAVSIVTAAVDSPTRTYTVFYAVAAVGMILGIVVILVSFIPGTDESVPLVFYGEAAALTFFALFWILQTVENWGNADASFR